MSQQTTFLTMAALALLAIGIAACAAESGAAPGLATDPPGGPEAVDELAEPAGLGQAGAGGAAFDDEPAPIQGEGSADTDDLVEKAGVIAYFDVYTGCRDNAGTDASVSIWFHTANSNKWHGPFHLGYPNYNDFEKCSAKAYRLDGTGEMALVNFNSFDGFVDNLYLAHNNAGSKPGWYVDNVYVRQWNGEYTNCGFYTWFSQGSGLGHYAQYCR